jgi:hypothetical protein
MNTGRGSPWPTRGFVLVREIGALDRHSLLERYPEAPVCWVSPNAQVWAECRPRGSPDHPTVRRSNALRWNRHRF